MKSDALLNISDYARAAQAKLTRETSLTTTKAERSMR